MRAVLGAVTGLLLLVPVGAATAQGEGEPYGYIYSPDGDSGLPYVAGLRGSFAFASDLSTNPASPVHTQAALDTGYGGSVYAGIRLGYGLTLEGEALFRHMPLSGLTVNGTATAAKGYSDVTVPFLNLMWDFPVPDFPIRPFIGAGIGAAFTNTAIRNPASTADYLYKDNWNFAYDLMGGAELPLSQSSRLTAMYRWMRVNNAGFACGTGGALQSCVSDITNRSVDLGLEMDL